MIGTLLGALLMSTAAARVETVWNGCDSFGEASVANEMSAAVRRPGRAAGRSMNAVFLHPNNERPATATYDLTLPDLAAGERLVFTAYAGMSDGVKPEEHTMDGVGVGLRIGDERLARLQVDEPSWTPFTVDLAPWAGRRVQLVLFTDDGGGKGNCNYDWAMIGEPQVVLLRGNILDERRVGRAVGGALLLELDAPTTGELRVVPLGADGRPVGEGVAHPHHGGTLTYAEFDFSALPEAQAVRIEPGPGTVKSLLAAPFAPALALQTLGARDGVVFAGRPLRVRAVLKNTGRGPFLADQALRVTLGGAVAGEKAVERLGPGETVTVEAETTATEPGEVPIGLGASWVVEAGAAPETLDEQTTVTVWPPLPPLPDELALRREVLDRPDSIVLQNPHARVVFCQRGAGPVIFLAAAGQGYRQVATAPAPAELCLDAEPAELGPPEVKAVAGGVAFEYPVTGADATVRATARLAPDDGLIEWTVELQVAAALTFRALRGPAVLVGDGAGGERKRLGLFPGLEYLGADEPSSSTRDFDPPLHLRLVPDPYKVTVPLMAVAVDDGLVAVLWDQRQRWYGERFTLSALFASPNFLDGQANHRLQLFAPAGTELVPENRTLAAEPFPLAAGEKVVVDQQILVRPGGDVLDALDAWYATHGGVPAPQPEPRSKDEQLALSRHGFMHTVWNAEIKKSMHCVGWAPANAPQFAALLLFDALLTGDPAGAAAAREHAELIARTTLEEAGEAGLASNACCHIMRGNLPFFYGHLDGAIDVLRQQAYGAMGSMGADGSWRFHPPEDKRMLGEDGAVELGTCAPGAASIWRWARITGDPAAIEAGRRALAFMDQFVVPAGAQGWECPIHEPDILAAAWAIRAYLDAWLTTEERLYLDRAIYWARTGLPFVYHWDDPTLPGQRYASIPVFGSTFRSHSWLGVPVQWCGLVYAYALLQLAPHDPLHPWEQVARGITISGMYQQFGDEQPDLKGCYPDGWYGRFTRRLGPFINPEDIAVCYLALLDHDPEVRTAVVTVGGERLHLSSGATIVDPVVEEDMLTCGLQAPVGLTTCAVLSLTARPRTVSIGGQPARFGEDLDAEGVNACYDEARAMLFLRVEHGEAPVPLRIEGLKRTLPPGPPAKLRWSFDRDAEGWLPANHCDLAVRDGVLVCTVTGVDPYFRTENASFEAVDHPVLVVRARATAGNRLGLFWGTAEAPGTDPSREVHQPLPADGQWHEVTFRLGGHPGWRSRITLLRFDLEPADVPPGSRLEIDWVEARPE